VTSAERMEVARSTGTQVPFSETIQHYIREERDLTVMSRQTKLYCCAVTFVAMSLFCAKMLLQAYSYLILLFHYLEQWCVRLLVCV
jgi:hypothetical protein